MIFKKKFLIVSFIFIIASILLNGCQKKEEIIAYWVSLDSQYSLFFDEDNTIVIDGKYMGEYKIYAEGKIAINVETDMFDEVLDLTMSAEYTIDEDILMIKDLESGEIFEYYTPEKAERFNKDMPPHAIKSFRYYDNLGYFDDDEIFCTEFDWKPDVKILEKMRNDAEKLFMEKILPLYEKENPKAKWCFFLKV